MKESIKSIICDFIEDIIYEAELIKQTEDIGTIELSLDSINVKTDQIYTLVTKDI